MIILICVLSCFMIDSFLGVYCRLNKKRNGNRQKIQNTEAMVFNRSLCVHLLTRLLAGGILCTATSAFGVRFAHPSSRTEPPPTPAPVVRCCGSALLPRDRAKSFGKNNAMANATNALPIHGLKASNMAHVLPICVLAVMITLSSYVEAKYWPQYR